MFWAADVSVSSLTVLSEFQPIGPFLLPEEEHVLSFFPVFAQDVLLPQRLSDLFRENAAPRM